MQGMISNADTQRYSNATVSHLDFDGVAAAMITLGGQGDLQGINLTFGSGQPKPFEFAEIAMVVEPPMADGSWPRLSGPCSLKNEVTVRFDETEIAPLTHSSAATPPKFHGTMKRSGLHINYTMAVDGDQDPERGAETWNGVWMHERNLRRFSLQTDVQGWHVFRVNTYLMTLPTGVPITLATVIEQQTRSDTMR